MATTNNGYSDLVHLFIDGEATETERNILFGALKDSPELQEEFSSAMRLKQAFASDIMQLQPPTYLQSQIAERAGIIIAATASAANAPVVTSAISSAMQNVAPIATGIFSKGVLTLVIGASVGILSTIGIIKLTSTGESPKAVAPIAATQSVAREAAPIVTAPQKMEAAPVENKSYTTYKSHKSYMTHAVLPNIDLGTAPKAITENISSNEIATTKNTVSNTPAIPGKSFAEPAMPEIVSISPLAPKFNIGSGNMTSHNPLAAYNEEKDGEPDWMTRSSIALSYRGLLGGGSFFQSHSDMAPAPSWDNFGLAAKYELSPFFAVAAEAGQETFPLYLKNKNGGYDELHSIGWGGVSATYSFYLWDITAIHPEIRALLGGSTAGPIGKISAGIVMMDGQHFGFSISPEFTGVAIKDHGV